MASMMRQGAAGLVGRALALGNEEGDQQKPGTHSNFPPADALVAGRLRLWNVARLRLWEFVAGGFKQVGRCDAASVVLRLGPLGVHEAASWLLHENFAGLFIGDG